MKIGVFSLLRNLIEWNIMVTNVFIGTKGILCVRIREEILL
jgi:hypothetical protein